MTTLVHILRMHGLATDPAPRKWPDAGARIPPMPKTSTGQMVGYATSDSIAKIADLEMQVEKLTNARGKQQIALQDRLNHLEKILRGFADKMVEWEKTHVEQAKLQKKHETCQDHFAALHERVNQLGKLLDNSTEKHAKWEQTYVEQAKLRKEHEEYGEHHAVLQKQITYLEEALRSSGERNTKWEQTHVEQAKLQKAHEIGREALQKRVAYLEEVHGDSATLHAKWDQAHAEQAKLQVRLKYLEEIQIEQAKPQEGQVEFMRKSTLQIPPVGATPKEARRTILKDRIKTERQDLRRGSSAEYCFFYGHGKCTKGDMCQFNHY